jgi:hypothetical protein
VKIREISASEAHNKNDNGKAGFIYQLISSIKIHNGTTNAARQR